MLLQFSGLLSLSLVNGLDFLAKDCLLMIMSTLNLFVLEEDDLDSLSSLFNSRFRSFSSRSSDRVQQNNCNTISKEADIALEEGSASDSRVLQYALSRPTGMKFLNEMDVCGHSQTNGQDRRSCRRIWTKEEKETLLSIMDEIVANSGRVDCGSFKAGILKSMESRLVNILPNYGLGASPHIESKLIAMIHGIHMYRKKTYTLENLAANVEENDNFDNEFEMLGNFSPMSVNQIDSNQPMYSTSSQPLSKKMSRSRDPIVRSIDRFANVMNDAIEKSNDTLDKFCQVLATNEMTENQVIANDLQKMQLPLLDQVHMMQKFM
ncbi:hypothetical protein EZV62_001881 [Acer yangbiense]|uniref:DUF7812 domain-containing protein n=1 Tax=Acer yangbiense TaxID=1000413 RepID=A0A5C7IXJ3_9ROSI|nr:hypothetical protein EZV62_001881 [Acer yangbiense]